MAAPGAWAVCVAVVLSALAAGAGAEHCMARPVASSTPACGNVVIVKLARTGSSLLFAQLKTSIPAFHRDSGAQAHYIEIGSKLIDAALGRGNGAETIARLQQNAWDAFLKDQPYRL